MFPFILGIGFGFLFSLNFGVVFLTITETSINRDFFSGFLVALGVSITDVIYVTIILLGFSSVLENPEITMAFGFVGGFVLMVFGLSFFFKKSKLNKSVSSRRRGPKIQYLLKGFVLNGFNPYVSIFWLGVLTLASTELNISNSELPLFFTGVLATILLMDTLKSWFAQYLKQFIEDKLIYIFKIMGVIFFFFGVMLIHSGYDQYIN